MASVMPDEGLGFFDLLSNASGNAGLGQSNYSVLSFMTGNGLVMCRMSFYWIFSRI